MIQPGIGQGDDAKVSAVSVVEVLQATIDLIKSVNNEVMGVHKIHNYNLWADIYIATSDGRYADALSATLRYLAAPKMVAAPKMEYHELWLDIYLATSDDGYSDQLPATLGYGSQAEDGTLFGAQDPERWEMTRVLLLLANLLEAEDASEIRAAIESIAAPIGSFAAKRRPAPYVMLGAYVGGRISCEWSQCVSEHERADYLGVALPIGLEVGHGFGSGMTRSNVGFFMSPIDLGLVAQYRLDGSSTVDPSKIRWWNLIAPSFYVVAAVPFDFPLSIASGVQYVPADGSKNLDATLRVSAFLAIDLPLLQL